MRDNKHYALNNMKNSITFDSYSNHKIAIKIFLSYFSLMMLEKKEKEKKKTVQVFPIERNFFLFSLKSSRKRI